MKRWGLLGVMLAACLLGGMLELRAQDTIRMTGVEMLCLDWRTAGNDETLIADVGNERQTILPKTTYEFDDTVSITLYCPTSLLSLKTRYSGTLYENVSVFLGLDVSGCLLLDSLDCGGYWNLISLDVKGCTALRYLDCRANNLTSLDVSACSALKTLDCRWSDLTSLAVSACTALETLDCCGNQLTSLDVSGCTALASLDCSRNSLTSLDVSACTALTNLDCGINSLTSLDVSGCTALTHLDCNCNKLQSLDVSACTALASLYCFGNDLTSLDVSACTALTHLDCNCNKLQSLDVSACTALESLNCFGNDLTSLDVSGCTALDTLDCQENDLTSLDVSACTALESLNCFGNDLTSLAVSACTALETLDCCGNQLTSLDVSGCTALASLDCSRNSLTSLDVSGCTALESLHCSENDLTSLAVYKNKALKHLTCRNCNLTSLDWDGYESYWGNRGCAQGNRKAGILDAKTNRFDLNSLPGFKVYRASNWKGGKVVDGHYLEYDSAVVTYEYLVSYSGIYGEPFFLRVKSDNTDLSFLKVTSQEPYVSRRWNNVTSDVSTTVPYGCERIVVEANVEYAKILSGLGEHQLVEGDNEIDIVVEAEDGTQKIYALMIRRQSADAALRLLTVSAGTLEPAFSSDVYDYNVEVPYKTSSLEVNAVARHDSAMVSGAGEYDLQVGDNDIKIAVTAENGTRQTYTLTVTRKRGSSDAALLSLTVSVGTLEPAFSPENRYYNVEVPYEIDSLEVEAEARHDSATVSGAGKYGLEVGYNRIEIVVMAEDGRRQVYRLSVRRKERVLSSDATLRVLSVSVGTLWPAFSPTNFNYRVEVPNDVKSMEVVAEPNDDSAKVSYVKRLSLAVGDNKNEIVVRAEDYTQQTYTLVVHRQKPKDPTAVESVAGLSDVRVYAQDGAIHLSKSIGELAVYAASGLCVYSGQAVVIPAPQPGLYIVRRVADGYSWKVVVR